MRRVFKYSLILLSPVLALVLYFTHYERFSRSLIAENNYYYEEANSIKHVYAAAQLYAVLDSVLPSDSAENLVRELGIANERMEQVVRSPKDTPAESTKDMCNNEVGIVLGKWHAAHPDSNRSLRELALMLADKKAMKMRATSVTVAPEKADASGQTAVTIAHEAADALRPEVIKVAMDALDASLIASHPLQQQR